MPQLAKPANLPVLPKKRRRTVPKQIGDLIEIMGDAADGVDVETVLKVILEFIPVGGGIIEKLLFANKDKKTNNILSQIVFRAIISN